MSRSFAFLICASLAIGACSGKGEYKPPVDPMLPGNGYAKVTPDCPPSVTPAQCAAMLSHKARWSH
jgi:hypothetical protein